MFIDLNDDPYCINLAEKNMDQIKRIVKKDGVITAQVGSNNKKPIQVQNWIQTLETSFGNSKISEVFIPSFDCNWNFVSSVNR